MIDGNGEGRWFGPESLRVGQCGINDSGLHLYDPNWCDEYKCRSVTVAIAAAPKVADPAAFGAVVKDRDGVVWVDAEPDRSDDYRWIGSDDSGGLEWTCWADVDAIEVLYPGATA